MLTCARRTRNTFRQLSAFTKKKGCLLIFFSNFLALTVKAEVASPNSSGSAAYSNVLVIVNLLFFMSVFVNTWAATQEVVANKDVAVRFPPAARVLYRLDATSLVEGFIVPTLPVVRLLRMCTEYMHHHRELKKRRTELYFAVKFRPIRGERRTLLPLN